MVSFSDCGFTFIRLLPAERFHLDVVLRNWFMVNLMASSSHLYCQSRSFINTTLPWGFPEELVNGKFNGLSSHLYCQSRSFIWMLS